MTEPVLVVADLSQIEARGLAWGAGQHDLIDTFERLDAAVDRGAPKDVLADLDVYTVTGRKMGMDRQGGKVGVLGGGYGAGRYAIRAFAKGYGMNMTEEEAQALVDAYRAANPMIVEMWQEEDNANKEAIQFPNSVIDRGITGSVMFNGRHLMRKLPSGRNLVYRNAKIEKRETPWGQMRNTVCHDANFFKKGTREFFREKMHGAKSVQRWTQALCRDILGVGLIRAKQAGLTIALHVHDEIGVQSYAPDTDGPKLRAAMTDPIRWCPGLPIASSVDVLTRYRKA